MKIGFTGTRKGMTVFQREEVAKIILYNKYCSGIEELHHGDCIGADCQFHYIACKQVGIPADNIVKHPAIQGAIRKRAYCQEGKELLAKSPLVRKHNIVDSVDIMIATPKESYEVIRSGTWATIRYARRKGIIIHIVYPTL